MKNLLLCFLICFPLYTIAQHNEITSMASDSTWKYVGSPGFSLSPINFNSIAISPTGQPYVIYDDSAGMFKATVRMFDGTKWDTVGTPWVTPQEVNDAQIVFNHKGQPFITFTEVRDTTVSARVLKYNGSKWDTVGGSFISSCNSYSPKLAFSPTDEPYLAFREGVMTGYLGVVKYNGTEWVWVGNIERLFADIHSISLVFNPVDGQPYVAFDVLSPYTDHVANVVKFNGTVWVYVGNKGFSPVIIGDVALAFNSAGQPYVSFGDNSVIFKATVMKFDNSQWVFVGDEGFSNGEAISPKIVVNPIDNLPNVAFNDQGLKEAVVMKFDGNHWINVGGDVVNKDYAGFLKLAVNATGQLYLAYADYEHGYKLSVATFKTYTGIPNNRQCDLSIYPNPASDKLVVDVLVGSPKLELSILNLQGQQVLNRKLWDANNIIDISPLPSGVYTVKVTEATTQMVRKFIKL